MELLWNEVGVQRLVYRGTQQTQIEGMVPLPEGKLSAELADYSASVEVISCRAEENKLAVTGSIEVTSVAVGEDGGVFSFVSTSDFSCEAEAPGVNVGMNTDALAVLKALSMRPAASGQLLLEAVIDIELTVTSAAPIRALSGISGLDDLELRTTEVSTGRRVELANETIRLGEEISSDGIDEVLKYNLQLSVRDTNMENGGACVSGMLSLNALCRSSEGEIVQLVRSIPFRETIKLNGTADEVYAVCELRENSVRSLGTEFSLIAVDADVNFRVFGMRRGKLNMPIDAFSPSLDFNCLLERIEILNSEGGTCGQFSVRDNISVPEGYPDIFTALHASANPIVTGIRFEGGSMEAEGLLCTRFVYRSSNNALESFSEDVPFTISMSAPALADFARIRLSAQPNITGGGGRTAQLSFSIDACAEFFGEMKLDAVVGIAENSEKAKADFVRGIVVYNACEGETFFDVAKCFRISLAAASSLNADIREPFRNGERLLLIV